MLAARLITALQAVGFHTVEVAATTPFNLVLRALRGHGCQTGPAGWTCKL